MALVLKWYLVNHTRYAHVKKNFHSFEFNTAVDTNKSLEEIILPISF